MTADDLILPYSIRTALANKEGNANSRDIASLFVDAHHQQRFGFYMLMKAAFDNDELQKRLLTETADHRFDFRRLDGEYAAPGLEYLAQHRKSTVEAVKLAEISRKGMGTWLSKYNTVLGEHAPNYKEVFVLAYAPLIGFDVLAKHTLLEGKPLSILKPGRYNTHDLPVGFKLEMGAGPGGGMDITELPNDFERPESALIFDDIVARGTARDTALEFWSRGDATQPDFHAVVELHAA